MERSASGDLDNQVLLYASAFTGTVLSEILAKRYHEAVTSALKSKQRPAALFCHLFFLFAGD